MSRVPFRVVFESSSDAKHSTAGRWQSARNCEYPQEVVVRLEELTALTAILLMAHERLTPSKVEVYVTDGDNDTAGYQRLGQVRFQDNAAIGYSAREQKKVSVRTKARYIRLVLHEPHPAPHNAHRQISLVAIEVYGDKVPVDTPSPPGAAAGDATESAQPLQDLVRSGSQQPQHLDLLTSTQAAMPPGIVPEGSPSESADPLRAHLLPMLKQHGIDRGEIRREPDFNPTDETRLFGSAFGPCFADCLRCRVAAARATSLVCLQMHLQELPLYYIDRLQLFKLTCAVLVTALADVDDRVLAAAVHLSLCIFDATDPGVDQETQFGSESLPSSDVQKGLHVILPLLLHRASDSSSVARDTSADALLILSRKYDGAKALVSTKLLHPELFTAFSPIAVSGMLSLLRLLVGEFPAGDGPRDGQSWNIPNIFNTAIRALQHPDPRVRGRGTALVVALHASQPALVAQARTTDPSISPDVDALLDGVLETPEIAAGAVFQKRQIPSPPSLVVAPAPETVARLQAMAEATRQPSPVRTGQDKPSQSQANDENAAVDAAGPPAYAASAKWGSQWSIDDDMDEPAPGPAPEVILEADENAATQPLPSDSEGTTHTDAPRPEPVQPSIPDAPVNRSFRFSTIGDRVVSPQQEELKSQDTFHLVAALEATEAADVPIPLAPGQEDPSGRLVPHGRRPSNAPTAEDAWSGPRRPSAVRRPSLQQPLQPTPPLPHHTPTPTPTPPPVSDDAVQPAIDSPTPQSAPAKPAAKPAPAKKSGGCTML